MDAARNRKIKEDRIYKTLGKMSIWRIILGILLLFVVLLISGTVSEFLASRGHFHAAETFMIAPGWMEEYKPQEKAYFAAGALYEKGEYEAALKAFETITDYGKARQMESKCLLAMAENAAAAGETAKAAELIEKIDTAQLNEEETAQLDAIKTK